MTNYKETLNLPLTQFPMKANLSQREPEILKKWQGMNLYRKIIQKNAGQPRFVLHDGPPYANGSLHLGHAINKSLKDQFNLLRVVDNENYPAFFKFRPANEKEKSSLGRLTSN